MKFQAGWILAALAATSAALPTANDEPAAEHAVEARQSCKLNAFRSRLVDAGATKKCLWEVCAGNNSWRLVRDCGTGSRCHANPTTCIARDGTPF